MEGPPELTTAMQQAAPNWVWWEKATLQRVRDHLAPSARLTVPLVELTWCPELTWPCAVGDDAAEEGMPVVGSKRGREEVAMHGKPLIGQLLIAEQCMLWIVIVEPEVAQADLQPCVVIPYPALQLFAVCGEGDERGPLPTCSLLYCQLSGAPVMAVVPVPERVQSSGRTTLFVRADSGTGSSSDTRALDCDSDEDHVQELLITPMASVATADSPYHPVAAGRAVVDAMFTVISECSALHPDPDVYDDDDDDDEDEDMSRGSEDADELPAYSRMGGWITAESLAALEARDDPQARALWEDVQAAQEVFARLDSSADADAGR
jgi:hypothetical protein